MPQKIWNPEDYNRQSVLQYNTAMSMLNTLTLRGDEKILDVGCGTGRITFQIAKERLNPSGKIVGIDINDRMITFAKDRYQSENLSFECRDVLELEYDNYFDIAISFWTLSWISLENQLTALKNIIHSLNEHGTLFLMYPMKHDAYDVVSEVIKTPRWSAYFVNYGMPRAFITDEQYQEEIIRNIPMDIGVERKEIECRYKDDKEMMESINCWLAHVDQIPSEQEKQLFLLDVANAYKKYRGINEPIMYYSVLEITGSKLTLQHSCTNALR